MRGPALGAQAGEARLREVVVHRRRLHALPPRDPDAVQPDPRGASVRAIIGVVLLFVLSACTSTAPSKKDSCGATVNVAPQPVVVGVCRE